MSAWTRERTKEERKMKGVVLIVCVLVLALSLLAKELAWLWKSFTSQL